jgi:serine/threonine protein kinase/formylglycine-generating enzyme required for sulfatase activity
LLCYRCGSHVPDNADTCANCGQKLAGGGVRQATATFSRRRLGLTVIDGAPYKQGDILLDRYTILDVVGMGPVGHVFRAHDKQIDVEVALKSINPRLVQTPEERKQFAKAIRQGRKLSHQNLVRAYEDGEDKDRPFYTMQFLEGLTLRKIIDLRVGKGQYFTMREVEPILGQIAAALDAAHKHGPHADLKPENIIVLPDLLKVSDYGLGNAIPRLPFVQAVKQRRADVYLAPEYAQGIEMDQRVDLYSLGVMVGEMLSGEVPDGSIPELTTKNRELPAQMEGLYRKALNANPLARPKTATEFFNEFSEMTRRISPPPLKAKPEPASPPRPRASGINAPLELVARMQDKPPPPVPDELLSDEHEVTSGDIEEIPADATQPIETAGVPPLPPPVPDGATELMPSLPNPPVLHRPLYSLEEPAEQTSTYQAHRNRTVLWLVVLTACGLLTGSLGGYWILERSRQPPPMEHPVEPPPPEMVNDAQKQAEEKRRADEAAAAEKTARDKAEQERLAQQKAADEKAAQDKAAQDKAAQERAALDKTPQDKPEDKRSGEAKPARGEGKNEARVATARAGCPDGMKQIPSGAFRIGTSKDDPMMGFDEKPLRSMELGAYCVDTFEYPNRRGAIPRVNVSWSDAKRLCEEKGKRLCTEEEWEKACKGPSNGRYPYGNQFDANACNTEDETGEDRSVAYSGKFSRCRSGFGISDLSGNVAEWTASPYASNADMTQKGGSFGRPDYAARCSARKNGSPNSRSPEVGFRCCADAAAP